MTGPGLDLLDDPIPAEPGTALAPLTPTLASLDAEAAVLGAVLLDGRKAADLVRAILTPATFFSAPHATLFGAMLAILDRDGPIDPITLREELVAHDLLEAVGGIEVIAELVDAVPTAANIVFHAAIVRDYAIRRKAIATLDRARLALTDRARPVAETLGASVGELTRSAPVDPLFDEPLRATAIRCVEELEERWKLGTRVIGHPSGCDALDAILLGFKPAELVVIAARPGMGKTAFALNCARHSAGRNDLFVAFFSLEMPRAALVTRLLGAEANVDLVSTYDSDFAKDAAVKPIARALEQVVGWSLAIDDRPHATPSSIRFRIDRLTQEEGRLPDLVIVDYLSLLDDEDDEGSHDAMTYRIGRRVRNLRALVPRALGISTVLLHQLSREHMKGEKPRRPRLTDLRDSGNIEEHADGVVFLHPTGEDGGHALDGRVEAIVEKNRNGPTGLASLHFARFTGRFKSFKGREEW